MRVVGEVLRLNAKRYPNKKALIEGDKALTYKQLNQQVNQLSNGLLSLGIVSGDRVAILADNCMEWVIVSFAIAKCGATAVPINVRYQKDELIYVVNNSEPKCIFFGPEFARMIADSILGFTSAPDLVLISGEPVDSEDTLEKLIYGKSADEPQINVQPNAPLSITYTSGTTGMPKGVLMSHAAFLNIYIGMVVESGLEHNDVMMVPIPLFHSAGMHGLVGETFLVGGTVLLMGKGFDPDRTLKAVSHYGVTVTLWVPTQLAMLINHPDKYKYDVSSMKKIWYGSSPISPTVLKASMDLFKAGFYQWYGQTETGMVAVLQPEDHLERSQFTGRELFNADLRVVDQDGQDTPIGEVGEIISSQYPMGMIGYHNMEEATRETIRDGWIYTGDLARVEANGYFTIADRTKDMIISGAENIYPKEIEAVISALPGVRDVAVFGIPDDIWGESVCAAVVKMEGVQLEEQDIVDFCASKLSRYKKPKRVLFLDEFPRTAFGKVRKNVLREPYWVGQVKNI